MSNTSITKYGITFSFLVFGLIATENSIFSKMTGNGFIAVAQTHSGAGFLRRIVLAATVRMQRAIAARI